jgi:hypothetical protein
MPTLFTNNKNPQKEPNRSRSADPDDQLFITHITIYRSGVILAGYLIILELVFLSIGLIIRLPLSLFITSIGANTLYTVNTIIYVGLTLVKLIFMIIIVFQWVENYYEVRPGKVIYKSGLFKRVEREFNHPDIEKITISQGFWGRLLNYGTITINVKISNEYFFISNIPNPHRNLKLIEKSLASKNVEITMTEDLIDD